MKLLDLEPPDFHLLRKSGHTARQILDEIDKWTQQSSGSEAMLHAQIKALPRYLIQRVPEAQMRGMKLNANQCHRNVNWYVDNDKFRESKKVRGWLVENGNFILHSVIDVSGTLACITPPNPPAIIAFVPDELIEQRMFGDEFRYFRQGNELPCVLRANPNACLERLILLRRYVEAELEANSSGR